LFQFVSFLFHFCFIFVSFLFHFCFIFVSFLFHFCFIFVSFLFHLQKLVIVMDILGQVHQLAADAYDSTPPLATPSMAVRTSSIDPTTTNRSTNTRTETTMTPTRMTTTSIARDERLVVEVMSLTYLKTDAQAGIAADLRRIDGLSIPVGLVIMGFVLQSARIALLPLVSVLVSAAGAFSLMLIVANHVDVISFCPSLMVSLLVAMSIDYSLFIASRFMEELREGADVLEAVTETVSTAGHMVLVSGAITASCLASLTVFSDDQVLFSCGLGGAISVLMCVVVNLNISPALFLTFPGFFAGQPQPSDRTATEHLEGTRLADLNRAEEDQSESGEADTESLLGGQTRPAGEVNFWSF
jgi:uncharacterized membrane protein YdfJ with MMPL/SSD domain